MNIGDQIRIATDFAVNPGARYRLDGDNSGQEFMERFLSPRLDRAIEGGYKILIDLDGVRGYPSSFVSGSFGKLSIDRGSDILLAHFEFKSDQNPLNIEKILREIRDPKNVQL